LVTVLRCTSSGLYAYTVYASCVVNRRVTIYTEGNTVQEY